MALGMICGIAEETVTRIVRVDVMVLERDGIVVVGRLTEELVTIGVEVDDGVKVEVVVRIEVDVTTDEDMLRVEEWW